MKNFDEYDAFCESLDVKPGDHTVTALGLTGEAAELVEKFLLSAGLDVSTGRVSERIKKLLRDNNGVVNHEMKEAIEKECGDVLW